MSCVSDYTNLWIGLTDLVDEGQYVYSSSGLKPFYSNWEKSQPDGGVEDNEDCAALHTPQRKWHDYPCSDNHSYVCKKPAKHFVWVEEHCSCFIKNFLLVFLNSFKRYYKLIGYFVIHKKWYLKSIHCH